MQIEVVLMVLSLGLSAHATYTPDEVKQCEDLALKIPSEYKPKPGDHSKWWIDKVTALTQMPAHIPPPPPQVNVCSAQSFLESIQCDSMYYDVTLNADFTRTVVTRAESKSFGNIVEYQKRLTLVSQTHLIFDSVVEEMTIYTGPNQSRAIDIPPYVQEIQGRLFAQVMLVPGKWELFCTCQGGVAWAVISPDAENSGERDAIYAQIDAALRKTRLQYTSAMKALDKQMLFNV